MFCERFHLIIVDVLSLTHWVRLADVVNFLHKKWFTFMTNIMKKKCLFASLMLQFFASFLKLPYYASFSKQWSLSPRLT